MEAIVKYFGHDTEFFQELEAYALKVTAHKAKVFKEDYRPGKIVESVLEKKVDLVFFDFTYSKNAEKSIYDEMVYVKRLENFKSTLFVAIFANYKDLRDHQEIFSSGFTFSYLKGEEEKLLFYEVFDIAFNTEGDFFQLAKANNLEFFVRAGVCSSLTALNSDYMFIESDIFLKNCIDDEISIGLNLFEDVEVERFPLEEVLEFPLQHSMLFTYKVSFPFVSSWEDDGSGKTLQQDTVDTWLDFNREEMLSSRDAIMIFCKDDQLLQEIYKGSEQTNLEFLVFNEVDSSKIEDTIHLNLPKLLFYDMGEETGTDLNSFLKVASALKSESIEPIVIMTNCPSSPQAVTKVFNYSNIITYGGPLEAKLVFKSIEIFMKKYPDRLLGDTLYFKRGDSRKNLLIFEEAQITSLTEHNMTFTIPFKIPLYTVLYFDLPLPMFVTVTISDDEMGVGRFGHHYKGVIHGMGLKRRDGLRRLINQFIFSPPKEISEDLVDALLSGSAPPEVEENEVEDNEEVIIAAKPQEKTKEKSVFEMKKRKGISKL